MNTYIAGFPPAVRTVLNQIRATVRAAAPNAEERISYRMPAFFEDGVIIYFAAFKKHIGVFPPVSDPTLKVALARYAGPKGNMQFPLDEPMPLKLITRIVKARLRENRARAKARRAK